MFQEMFGCDAGNRYETLMRLPGCPFLESLVKTSCLELKGERSLQRAYVDYRTARKCANVRSRSRKDHSVPASLLPRRPLSQGSEHLRVLDSLQHSCDLRELQRDKRMSIVSRPCACPPPNVTNLVSVAL